MCERVGVCVFVSVYVSVGVCVWLLMCGTWHVCGLFVSLLCFNESLIQTISIKTNNLFILIKTTCLS